MQINRDDLYLSVACSFQQSSRICGVGEDKEAEIRQGTWTNEEIVLVETLIELFKSGSLFLPDGISLNDFLCSLFLCKRARLRKKIKYESNCTHIFKFRRNQRERQINLPILQNLFLNSLSSGWQVSTLRFNMRRMWTSFFYEFCLEHKVACVSYQDYVTSVHEIQNRINLIKEDRDLRKQNKGISRLLISHIDYSTIKCDSSLTSHSKEDKWNRGKNISNERSICTKSSFLLGGLCKKPEIVPFYVKTLFDDSCAVSDVSLSPLPKPRRSYDDIDDIESFN